MLFRSPPSRGVADAGRSTTARARPPKGSADRAPQASAAPEPVASQRSPEPSPAAKEPTSDLPPTPVAVQDPVVLDSSTRTAAVAAPPASAPDVIIAPELIRKVNPVYPAAAVSAELEGNVTLAGVIGIDGKVSNIRVLQSTHPLLNEAARKAWLQYEYKPGRRNGVPEPTPYHRTFTFKLQ